MEEAENANLVRTIKEGEACSSNEKTCMSGLRCAKNMVQTAAICIPESECRIGTIKYSNAEPFRFTEYSRCSSGSYEVFDDELQSLLLKVLYISVTLTLIFFSGFFFLRPSE